MNDMSYVSKYLKSFEDFRSTLESLENKGVDVSRQIIDLEDQKSRTDISYDDFIKDPNNNMGMYTEEEYNAYKAELLKSIDEKISVLEPTFDEINESVKTLVEAKQKEIEKIRKVVESQLATLNLVEEDLTEDIKNAKTPVDIENAIKTMREHKKAVKSLNDTIELLEHFENILFNVKNSYENNFNEESLYTFSSYDTNSEYFEEIIAKNNKMEMDIFDTIDYRLHVEIENIDEENIRIKMTLAGRNAVKEISKTDLPQLKGLMDKFTKEVAAQTVYTQDMITNAAPRLIVDENQLGFVSYNELLDSVKTELGLDVKEENKVEEKTEVSEVQEENALEEVVETQESTTIEEPKSESTLVEEQVAKEETSLENVVEPTENKDEEIIDSNFTEETPIDSENSMKEVEEEMLEEQEVLENIESEKNESELTTINVDYNPENDVISFDIGEQKVVVPLSKVENINEIQNEFDNILKLVDGDLVKIDLNIGEFKTVNDVPINEAFDYINKQIDLDGVISTVKNEVSKEESTVLENETVGQIEEIEPQTETAPVVLEKDELAKAIDAECIKVESARKIEFKSDVKKSVALATIAAVGLGLTSGGLLSGLAYSLVQAVTLGSAVGFGFKGTGTVYNSLYYPIKRRKIEKELDKIAQKHGLTVVCDYEKGTVKFEDANHVITSQDEIAQSLQESLDESKVFKNSLRGVGNETIEEAKRANLHPVTIDYLEAAFEEVGGVKTKKENEKEKIEEITDEPVIPTNVNQKELEEIHNAEIAYDELVNGNIKEDEVDLVTKSELSQESGTENEIKQYPMLDIDNILEKSQSNDIQEEIISENELKANVQDNLNEPVSDYQEPVQENVSDIEKQTDTLEQVTEEPIDSFEFDSAKEMVDAIANNVNTSNIGTLEDDPDFQAWMNEFNSQSPEENQGIKL